MSAGAGWATTADGQPVENLITIAPGQVATLDLDVAPVVTGSTDANASELDDVIVTGRRIFEVRTSEVATNVSQAQINNLPQISRSFLNFAALAPGVRVSEGETERTIAAGGPGESAVNTFIDSQNQKSTIIDCGTLVRLGHRGDALRALDFYLANMRPRAWNGWAEVVVETIASPVSSATCLTP